MWSGTAGLPRQSNMEVTMRSLSKLVFLVALSVVLSTLAPRSIQARSGDDYCSCQTSTAYIYNVDPVYGPWMFLDQENSESFGFSIGPEENYAVNLCVNICYAHTVDTAHHLCDVYGFENHHWQVQSWIYFSDTDNDDGGTGTYLLDSGSTIRMCDDYF
jgi:hypothetical protein